MIQVVSFSLWGSNKNYTVGAIENAKLAQSIYAGWECWFYCHRNVPVDVCEELLSVEGTRVITKDDFAGLFWRFLPAADSSVERFVSRDCDSRLSWKEKSAVDEWIDGKQYAHSMHDHRNHRPIIMGGMCGFRYGVMTDVDVLIEAWTKRHGFGYNSDQRWLSSVVYGRVQNSILFHGRKTQDKRTCDTRQFPVITPVPGGFVGAKVRIK